MIVWMLEEGQQCDQIWQNFIILRVAIWIILKEYQTLIKSNKKVTKTKKFLELDVRGGHF